MMFSMPLNQLGNKKFVRSYLIHSCTTHSTSWVLLLHLATFDWHFLAFFSLIVYQVLVLPQLGLAIFNKVWITQDGLLQILMSKMWHIGFLSHGSIQNLMNLENLENYQAQLFDKLSWLKPLEIIRPRSAGKFSKFMIQEADWSHFGPNHLKKIILSCPNWNCLLFYS